jgi:hypothetical protein
VLFEEVINLADTWHLANRLQETIDLVFQDFSE